MKESRRTSRQRTYKGGSVSFDAAPSIDCIIRNLSETGACLEFQIQTNRIPDGLTLIIKPELLKRVCKVVWRSANRIGVHFE